MSTINTTLAKGLDILLLFDENSPTLEVPEIAEAIHLPESTTYRYVKTLTEKGFLDRDQRSGSYQLGLRLLDLARIVRQRLSIVNTALPIMRELANETRETVILTMVQNQQAVCIERIESPRPIRLSFERGRARPLHAGASAKVLMAYLDERAQEEIINHGLQRFTENTITNPEAMRAELQRIRSQGFVLSRQELDSGAAAVAAPIFGGTDLVAGLSVAGPMGRMEAAGLDRLTNRVREAAEQISQQVTRLESI